MLDEPDCRAGHFSRSLSVPARAAGLEGPALLGRGEGCLCGVQVAAGMLIIVKDPQQVLGSPKPQADLRSPHW